MLMDFGPCPNCPDDFDGDGDVTTADIALLLLNFGPTGLIRPSIRRLAHPFRAEFIALSTHCALPTNGDRA